MTYPPQPPGGPYGNYQQPLPNQFPQGGYYQQQPVPKKRTGLIIGIVVAVVVILGGAGAGAWFLFFAKGGQSDPETVAHTVIDALNKKDEPAVLALTCPAYQPTLKKALDQPDSIIGSAASLTFSFQGIQTDGDKATVKMHYDGTVNGKNGATDDTIALRRDAASGNWSVCPQKKN